MSTIRSTSKGSTRRSARMIAHAAGMNEGAAHLELLEPRQMMNADPVTGNNPLWMATYGTPKVDGFINESEWAGTTPIVRTQATRNDTSVTVRMMYNENGLFISVDARTPYLWSDGSGGGAGSKAEFWNDDSMSFYFDPVNSRKAYLQGSGRIIGLNLGQIKNPINGPGRVLRFAYGKGDGHGSGIGITPDNGPYPGTRWQTHLWGTLNNNNDVDTGWTTELFMPWASLNMPGMPVNGKYIGMNFQMLFNNFGGVPDPTSLQNSTNVAQRMGPSKQDDDIQGVYSSVEITMSGYHGPMNYAFLQFNDPRAADQPSMIGDLAVGSVNGYGARLNFTAPFATQTNLGSVSAYEIRFSSSPITTDADFAAATVVQNSFVPKLAGRTESLRIGQLTPDTTYYFAVRGVDAAGREGALAAVSFTTLDTAADRTNGERLMVSPGGNTLMTESGQPFIMQGTHVTPTSLYVRTLYTGDIWSIGQQQMVNFSDGTVEGGAVGYFDALKAAGVNTLRVPLEWLMLDDPASRTNIPNGTPWLEYPAGNFNPAMFDFLNGLMEQAARTGIYLVIHPFGTYNYRHSFDLTPWSTANGGPLTTIDNFFQNPTVLQMAMHRMDVLDDWVHSSPFGDHVLGMELINEWDAWGWTRNPSGNSDPARLVEMRQRATFMTSLAQHVHSYDPDMLVLSSTIGQTPRGPLARALFLSDAFDVLNPHFYTSATEEPANNTDSDKSVRAATQYGTLAAYWLTNRRDQRPVNNGEWGHTASLWQGGQSYYTGISPNAPANKPFTLAQDEAIFRTTAWTQLASGMAGTGERIQGQDLRDLFNSMNLSPGTTGYVAAPLSFGMQETLKSVAAFAYDDGLAIDWDHFTGTTLAGHMSFGNRGGHRLLSWGTTDSHQGLAYVLNDGNVNTSTVSGATMTIEGVVTGGTYEAEVWSCGTNAGVIATLTGLTAVNGRITLALPDFAKDVMIKFTQVA